MYAASLFHALYGLWISSALMRCIDSTQIPSANDRFIWVGALKTDFSTANTFCHQTFDTWLASIHSEAENIEITNLCVANAAEKMCYIGLTDSDNEGTFVWVDGSNLDYIASQFVTDNANHNGVDEDCVVVSSGGRWDDTPCHTYNPYSFICNAPTSSPTSDPTIQPSNEPTADP
eukprot:203189_1